MRIKKLSLRKGKVLMAEEKKKKKKKKASRKPTEGYGEILSVFLISHMPDVR